MIVELVMSERKLDQNQALVDFALHVWSPCGAVTAMHDQSLRPAGRLLLQFEHLSSLQLLMLTTAMGFSNLATPDRVLQHVAQGRLLVFKLDLKVNL